MEKSTQIFNEQTGKKVHEWKSVIQTKAKPCFQQKLTNLHLVLLDSGLACDEKKQCCNGNKTYQMVILRYNRERRKTDPGQWKLATKAQEGAHTKTCKRTQTGNDGQLVLCDYEPEIVANRFRCRGLFLCSFPSISSRMMQFFWFVDTRQHRSSVRMLQKREIKPNPTEH